MKNEESLSSCLPNKTKNNEHICSGSECDNGDTFSSPRSFTYGSIGHDQASLIHLAGRQVYIEERSPNSAGVAARRRELFNQEEGAVVAASMCLEIELKDVLAAL
ncbi:G3BP-like protein [Pyrus ussuriensis x Pyrus communis]|uniref:G3BP-like protein n=1 Tax=Pyrus ussuriensis x Pyrus communis TaxID=2448454 RepID=A0A5N5F9X2_9ROSA|nr:G3BP-like protein [Pyrus ussuriensis x Pyrus communis]